MKTKKQSARMKNLSRPTKTPVKGRTNKPRISKNDDYVWKVLSLLVKDVEKYITSDEGLIFLQQYKNIIRQKDILGYIEWCESTSLTKVNEAANAPDITEIRAMRLLTWAQKYDFVLSPIDTEAVALEKFLKFEKLCARTNKDPLFTSLFTDAESPSVFDDVFVVPVLRHAMKFISSVLGDCQRDAIFHHASHGPGATVDKRGNDAIPIAKFAPPFAVTPLFEEEFLLQLCKNDRWCRSLLFAEWRELDASPIESCYCGDFNSFLASKPELSKSIRKTLSNEILFVPKNASTKRTVALEPSGNVYGQLAVDKYIRPRLLRWGLDLSTQEKNKSLAFVGSSYGTHCTIDFSGASECVALILLKLFPDEWTRLLMDLRAPSGVLPNGEILQYEKVSSMGNGYTFVLETLIFASMIYGVIKHRGENWSDHIRDIAVYGDDIVVPQSLYSDLALVYRRIGFRLNLDKSFSTGLIRESCGADWFAGQSITRPTISKKPVDNWELRRDHNLFFLLSKEWYMPLDATCTGIRSWLTSQQQGPVSEDVISWLFSYDLDNVKIDEKASQDWQRPVYLFRRTVLKYKILKKSDPRRKALIDFEPMMCLQKDLSSDDFSVPWVKTFRKNGILYRGVVLEFTRKTSGIPSYKSKKGLVPEDQFYYNSQVLSITTANAQLGDLQGFFPKPTLDVHDR